MAYSALAVANAFIQKAQEGKLPDLTPMKLQKLLFYVQSWYLRNHANKPLFDDFFARWKHGPVIPSLYHEFKPYGSGVITAPGSHLIVTKSADGTPAFEITTPKIDDSDDEAKKYIEDIIRVYGGYTGWQLSWMTHQPGTAWNVSGLPDGGVIPLETMAKHINPSEPPTH